jgi:hypothetical protein
MNINSITKRPCVLVAHAKFCDSPHYYITDKKTKKVRYFTDEKAEHYIDKHGEKGYDEILVKNYTYNPDFPEYQINGKGPEIYG